MCYFCNTHRHTKKLKQGSLIFQLVYFMYFGKYENTSLYNNFNSECGSVFKIFSP